MLHSLQSMNENEKSNSDNQNKTTGQWADLIEQLFDRLTGKSAQVTYSFDNLVIDIPKAVGPGGKDMGSAKWTVNGKFTITAETAHNKSQGF